LIASRCNNPLPPFLVRSLNREGQQIIIIIKKKMFFFSSFPQNVKKEKKNPGGMKEFVCV
jgi:hypothetical protein